MLLADYLKTENMKPSHFALMLGVPPSTILRLISGKRKDTSLNLLKKILEATNGRVTPNDFAGVGVDHSDTEAGAAA